MVQSSLYFKAVHETNRYLRFKLAKRVKLIRLAMSLRVPLLLTENFVQRVKRLHQPLLYPTAKL